MIFKELKAGYPVYALKKGDTIEVKQGKVVNIAQPRADQMKPMSTPYQQMPQNMQLVVDVTIDIDGAVQTYSIPESLSVTYAGSNLTLATDKDGILREVEALRNQSEEVLNSIEKHKEIVAKCDEIMSNWSMLYKEKKETDARFNKLETAITDIKQTLSDFIKELKS